jgi:hypothetical protein
MTATPKILQGCSGNGRLAANGFTLAPPRTAPPAGFAERSHALACLYDYRTAPQADGASFCFDLDSTAGGKYFGWICAEPAGGAAALLQPADRTDSIAFSLTLGAAAFPGFRDVGANRYLVAFAAHGRDLCHVYGHVQHGMAGTAPLLGRIALRREDMPSTATICAGLLCLTLAVRLARWRSRDAGRTTADAARLPTGGRVAALQTGAA